LNKYFIAIKVDREERPDIDAIYMQAAQMMIGRGGWPLNVLLTPDKKPFYAATYMPKNGRFGRIGLMQLAERIGTMWQQDRQKIEESAASLTKAVQERVALTGGGEADAELVEMKLADEAYDESVTSFDGVHGGFGAAPKFPSPHRLLFLLRYGALKDQPNAIRMVENTLAAMYRGGIHDHLGGGFHRYSTDESWLLPHFEKMLYDQAMLLMAYAEGWQLTGNADFEIAARAIADYLLRDMQHDGGAFYSAEDADSEGEEGKFYVWTEAELDQLLGKRAEPFKLAYGVKKEGNFIDEASHQYNGTNILHLTGKSGAGDFAAERRLLFNEREKRIHPFKEDKILTDWNGLAIAALAVAGRILNEPRYISAADKAAGFVLKHLRTDDGALLHRWRAGDAAITGQLEDYTSMVWGLIELYGSRFDAKWLAAAIDLNAQMLNRFKAESGGFYQTEESNDLIARPMESFDGALPSGNAVAMSNLLKLSRLTGNAELEASAAGVANAFAGITKKAPSGFVHMLSSVLLANSSGKEIVLAGNKNSAQAGQMLDVIRSSYRPNAVVLWHDKQIEKLAPFTKGHKP
ncbi:MAG: thioredoxin domain-containing protein, partial [Mariprofundus sp.]